MFECVVEVCVCYGLFVIKVIGIVMVEDVKQIDVYGQVVDQFLVDVKVFKDFVLSGGNGLVFDWQFINCKFWFKLWMLVGGLMFENVVFVVQMIGVCQVDMVLGVESVSGVKDLDLMCVFIMVVWEMFVLKF